MLHLMATPCNRCICAYPGYVHDYVCILPDIASIKQNPYTIYNTTTIQILTQYEGT